MPDPLPPELALEAEPISDDQLDDHAADVDEAKMLGLRAPPPPFTIDNLEKAEWAMRKLAAINAEKGAAVAQAEEWRSRIDDWIERATWPLVRRAAYLEGLLIDFARRRREEDPKHNKSLMVPSGIVRSCARAPAPEVVDESQVLGWALVHLDDDQLDRVAPRSLSKRELKKRLRIEERVVGRLYEIEYGDGHRQTTWVPGEADPGLPQPGEVVACPVCGSLAAARSVEATGQTTLLVLPLDGDDPVPGVEVKPAEVTFTVTVEGP